MNKIIHKHDHHEKTIYCGLAIGCHAANAHHFRISKRKPAKTYVWVHGAGQAPYPWKTINDIPEKKQEVIGHNLGGMSLSGLD